MTLGEDGVYRGQDVVNCQNYSPILDQIIIRFERNKFNVQSGWFVSEPVINTSQFDGNTTFFFDVEKHPTMEDALTRYQQEGIEFVDGKLVSKNGYSR